ncbi:MFS transporter, partial [Aliarcobacter butzleri]
MSGFIATTFPYEYVFYSLPLAILVSITLIKKLDYNGEATIIKPKINEVINNLQDKRFVIIYFVMCCIFF